MKKYIFLFLLQEKLYRLKPSYSIDIKYSHQHLGVFQFVLWFNLKGNIIISLELDINVPQ